MILNIDNIDAKEKAIAWKRECKSDIYKRLVLSFMFLP